MNYFVFSIGCVRWGVDLQFSFDYTTSRKHVLHVKSLPHAKGRTADFDPTYDRPISRAVDYGFALSLRPPQSEGDADHHPKLGFCNLQV